MLLYYVLYLALCLKRHSILFAANIIAKSPYVYGKYACMELDRDESNAQLSPRCITVCLHFPAFCPQHTLAWCYNDQENEVHIVWQQVVIDLAFQQAYKLCITLRDLTQTKLVLCASLCMWPGFTFKDVGIDCSKIYKEIKQPVPPLPRLSGAGVHFPQMVIEIFTSHVFILELD